jgi:tetratricopeptide (TPR) repeat protein
MAFSRLRWGAVLAIPAVLIGIGLVLWLRSPVPGKPIHVTYPLEGTLFPNDIVPPTFRWEDPSGVKQWRITFEFSDGGARITGDSDTPSWRPSKDQWDSIKKRSLEHDAQVAIHGVTGETRDKVLSRGKVSLRTSKDPVGSPIFYRDVPLPFKEALEHLDAIRWRLGSVSSAEPPPTLLDKMPVCGNCHSFSADGSILAMDVDYGADKGAYIITEVKPETVFESDKVITWSDFRPEDGQLTFGLLSQISPDGRHVISTVKDRSVFVPLPELYYSQFFFPVQGILAVYDRSTKKFSALPGADDPRYVQSNPAWSPDGKWIVFTRAEAHELRDLKNKQNPVIAVEEAKEFVSGGQKMRYDLYRIPFNGGKGGRAEPIPGASGNGKSNYFPKFSPDGKWMVFCQADAFMLLRPDSSLFIMPADGGNPRRLVCNRDQKMNSWHSWSPNGKWLVFASKANGPYTQLWLTHIDESGNDTPAVLLEHFTDANRAANIPEFVNLSTGGLTRIRQRFGDEFAFALRSGQIHVGTGNYRKAAEALRKALKIEPDNVEVLGRLASVLLKLKEVEQAKQLLEKAAARDPKNADIQYKLGIAMLEKREYPAAIDHCNKALALDPGLFPARIILGHALQGSGRLEEALQRYKELVAEGVEDSGLYNHYGEALLKLKQYQEAIPQFQKALQIDPSNTQARENLSRALKTRSGKPG